MRNSKNFVIAAVGVGVMVAAAVGFAAPASAKNVCGPLNIYRDGALSATGRVVQSCDKGTTADYTVHCVAGTTHFSRSYPQSFSAVTYISCAGNVGPILSVGVDYR